jgi:DNA helicase-2/ATP-dependent DNA helicase PcrA
MQLAALGQDTDQYAAGEDRVALLTVHQAKGLEFDTVFVAQACEGEFPSQRSVSEGRLDEEHRLFYVAVTRARRRLYCTWSRWRQGGGKLAPSRYLAYLRAEGTR